MRTTKLWISARILALDPTRGRGDRGEGGISTAIAVLIMAFLGAAMWIGFQQMWQTTSTTTNHKVEQIGND